VESGADPRSVLPRLKELEAERGRLQEAESLLSGGVVDIQPPVAHHYRMIVRNLRAELAYPPPAGPEPASKSGAFGTRAGRSNLAEVRLETASAPFRRD
jgi:hypothetical protein